MFVIRPIALQDMDAYNTMALSAELGMLHMPKLGELQRKLIEKSILSFAKEVIAPENEYYTFVLENLVNGEVGGLCSICAKKGVDKPVCYYQIQITKAHLGSIPVFPEQKILNKIQINHGPTEACSLYLLPNFRQGGLGRLLSLSRFLFMASFPQRMDTTIIAEMRSFIDKENSSPFWVGLGKHFVNLKYHETMMIMETKRDIIIEALPNMVYTSLLSQDCQNAIGKIDAGTLPALKMLMQEGFSYTNYIDPIDGGPVISAKLSEIRTVKQSKVINVNEICPESIESPLYIVSNQKIDFRCTYGNVIRADTGAIVSKETAEVLQVKKGDAIRFIEPKIVSHKGAHEPQ